VPAPPIFESMSAPRLYSLGHSTRTLADLLEILDAHGVATLADIRKIPGSRRFPHFNRDVLMESLPQAGIDYVPLRSSRAAVASRPTPRHQRRLAQRELPRLCGLHGDRRVRGRPPAAPLARRARSGSR